MNEGARSYSGKVVGGDSYAITINFKWFLQVCSLIGGLVYGFIEIENRITTLEKEVLEAHAEIKLLVNKHQLEESVQLEELEKKLKFYEKELKLNINPLSWRKRKK